MTKCQSYLKSFNTKYKKSKKGVTNVDKIKTVFIMFKIIVNSWWIKL